MTGPETQIRIGIRNLLRQLGFAVWDLEQNRPTRQTAGFSDLVAMGHGRILFVEVKTPRGRLTPFQSEFSRAVRDNSGTFVVWRSTTDAWAWMVTEGIVRDAG